MAERICLLTFCPTKCKDACFNCDCGGQGATKDMYVSINNVQRVCAIIGGAADTEEGTYIAEVIRNNLEDMVIEAQPVKHGRWIITDDVEHFIAVCSECGRTEDSRCIKDMPYCHCGARMNEDAE